MIRQVPTATPGRRVLLVLDHFYPFVGGAETLTRELSRGLAARGEQVTVVTTRQPGTGAVETIDGVEIHRVWTPRWLGRCLFIFLALPALLRYGRKADVIHAGVYASAFPAWLCGKMLRKPTVLTVYEVLGDQWQQWADTGWLAGWAFRAYEWFLLRLPFTRLVCISQFTGKRLQQLAGVPPERISVVYPAVDYGFWDRSRHQPVDLRKKLRLGPEAFLYLYFGRPGGSKGLDTLVAAAARVRAARPASRLVMVLAHQPAQGRQRVLRHVHQLGLEDHVTFLEPVPRAELPGYLLGADCVVVPSLSEGFGYSAVEAATLGCRVIATRGHAVEEVLGESVCLVPPRDPEALARAVLNMAAARPAPPDVPRQFTLESHVAGTLEVYRAVLAGALAPVRASDPCAAPEAPRAHGKEVPLEAGR